MLSRDSTYAVAGQGSKRPICNSFRINSLQALAGQLTTLNISLSSLLLSTPLRLRSGLTTKKTSD